MFSDKFKGSLNFCELKEIQPLKIIKPFENPLKCVKHIVIKL